MIVRGRVFGWSAAQLAVLVTAVYVVCLVLGFVAAEQPVRVVWGWPVPGSTVVMLTLIWPGQGQGGGASWRPFAAKLAGLWALFVITGGLLDVGWWRAAGWGAIELGAVTGLLAAYRRWVSPTQWFPERPRQLLAVAGLTILAGILTAADAWWGIGPEGPLERGPELLLWYAAGWSTRVMIGGVIGLAWAHPLREDPSQTRPWIAGVWLPVSLVGLLVAGLNPGLPLMWLPLMWLPLVPALAIGLSMAPRWGSFAASALGVLVWVTPHAFPGWSAEDGLIRPAALNVTALAALMFAMTLVLVRHHQGVLDDGVENSRRVAAAQNAVLDAMISAMADGVLLADREGAVLLANAAARAMLGPPAGGVVAETGEGAGWVAHYRLLGDGGRQLRAGEITALEAPGKAPVRVPLATRDERGELRSLQATAQEIPAGGAAAVLVVLTDETVARARRRELEAFAAVVAHDLRNPLGAASLWLDAAAMQWEEPGGALESALLARAASRRMRQVIEDYLAYAVGREGVLRLEDVNVAEVVGAVAALYGGPGGGPTIELPEASWVRADEALLRQVFANVIGNAVKYARRDEPAFVRVRIGADAPTGWVRILVEDKGIGMEDSDAEAMFAPFGRTARGASVEEGTGLGLALCRDIVTRHGGTITARRNDWGGTTIELLLPQAGAGRLH